MEAHNGFQIFIDVWPFLPTIFDNSTKAAWPHEKGKAVSPLLAWYTWNEEKDDKFWLKEMKRAMNNIRLVAEEEDCIRDGAPIYLNTSLCYVSVFRSWISIDTIWVTWVSFATSMIQIT
jgi:hypothetical protein